MLNSPLYGKEGNKQRYSLRHTVTDIHQDAYITIQVGFGQHYKIDTRYSALYTR